MLPAHRGLDRPIADYEDEEQFAASPTQAVILLQPAANPLPMLVFLIATQKTRATRTTIKVYSTKPCPSSSTNKRFKSSILISPPSYFELISFRPTSIAATDREQSSNCASMGIVSNSANCTLRQLNFTILLDKIDTRFETRVTKS